MPVPTFSWTRRRRLPYDASRDIHTHRRHAVCAQPGPGLAGRVHRRSEGPPRLRRLREELRLRVRRATRLSLLLPATHRRAPKVSKNTHMGARRRRHRAAWRAGILRLLLLTPPSVCLRDFRAGSWCRSRSSAASSVCRSPARPSVQMNSCRSTTSAEGGQRTRR